MRSPTRPRRRAPRRWRRSAMAPREPVAGRVQARVRIGIPWSGRGRGATDRPDRRRTTASSLEPPSARAIESVDSTTRPRSARRRRRRRARSQPPTSRTYQSAWTPTSGSARRATRRGNNGDSAIAIGIASAAPTNDPSAPGRKPANVRWPVGHADRRQCRRVAAPTGQEPAERLSCDQQTCRRGDGRSDQQRVALQIGGVR